MTRPDPSDASAEAQAGRFASTEALLPALRSSNSMLDHVWAATLSAQWWLADRARGVAPSLHEASRYLPAEPHVRGVARHLCWLGARVAILEFDRDSFDRWVALQEALVLPDTEEPTQQYLVATRAWKAVLDADSAAAQDQANLLRSLATAAQDAAMTIEANVVRAMADSLLGAHAAAVAAARRASRMARTEALPQQEYLANVVLARVRRLAGKAHMGAFILGSLRRYTPPQWHRWIDWELACSTREGERDLGHPPDVGALLRAAATGERSRYEAALGQTKDEVKGVSFAQQDVTRLHQLVDHTAASADTQTRGFVGGSVGEVPSGLHAVGYGAFGGTAWVLGSPDLSAARRVLGAGVDLASRETNAHILKPTEQARTDSAICVLLLSGSAGDELMLFQEFYGFPYDSLKHKTVRSMLYKRIRERLGEHGTLTREDGRLTLRLRKALLVPDPRCSGQGDHSLLRLLARRGTLSAKEAAERLGIPLRTAQHILKSLAEDGACRSEKVGRAVQYHIEDTTYCEPTRA